MSPKVTLKGFKMFVVEDWLFNTAKFHNAVVFPTGNEEDSITCALVKIKESKFVTVQEKAYFKSFFMQSDTSGFSPCPVCSPPPKKNPLQFRKVTLIYFYFRVSSFDV